jgi:hypothetical protein
MENHMDMNESTDVAIQGLQIARQEILSRINRLKECLRSTDDLIDMLGGNGHAVMETSRPPTLSDAGSLSQDSAYAGLKTQVAVERLLRERQGQWFKSSDVAKELVRLGLPRGGKGFSSTIAGSLNRAVQKDIVVREKQNGVFAYSWKTEDYKSAVEVSVLQN